MELGMAVKFDSLDTSVCTATVGNVVTEESCNESSTIGSNNENMSNFQESTLQSDTLTQFKHACLCCGLLITNLEAWTVHRKSEICRNNRKCNECARIFATVYIKDRHRKSCHNSTDLQQDYSHIRNKQSHNEVPVSQETEWHGSTRVEAVKTSEESKIACRPADKSNYPGDNIMENRTDIRIDSRESNNRSLPIDNYPKNNVGNIREEAIHRICCDELFTTSLEWTFHRNFGLCVKDRRCVECKLVFPTARELKDHRKIFHIVKTPELQYNNIRQRGEKSYDDITHVGSYPKRERTTLWIKKSNNASLPIDNNLKNDMGNINESRQQPYDKCTESQPYAVMYRCFCCDQIFPNALALASHRHSGLERISVDASQVENIDVILKSKNKSLGAGNFSIQNTATSISHKPSTEPYTSTTDFFCTYCGKHFSTLSIWKEHRNSATCQKNKNKLDKAFNCVTRLRDSPTSCHVVANFQHEYGDIRPSQQESCNEMVEITPKSQSKESLALSLVDDYEIFEESKAGVSPQSSYYEANNIMDRMEIRVESQQVAIADFTAVENVKIMDESEDKVSPINVYPQNSLESSEKTTPRSCGSSSPENVVGHRTEIKIEPQEFEITGELKDNSHVNWSHEDLMEHRTEIKIEPQEFEITGELKDNISHVNCSHEDLMEHRTEIKIEAQEFEIISELRDDGSPVRSSPEDLMGNKTNIKIVQQETALSDATTEQNVFEKSKKETLSNTELGWSMTEKYPICVHCMKAFDSVRGFKKHQNSKVCIKVRRCGKCNVVFDSVAILQHHRLSSHERRCKKCGRAFYSKGDFSRQKKGRKTRFCRECKSSGQMHKGRKKSILSEDYSKDTTPCSVRLVRLSEDDGPLTERDKLLLSKGVDRMDVELDVSDGSAMMSVIKSVATNTLGSSGVRNDEPFPENIDPFGDLRIIMTSERPAEEDLIRKNESNRPPFDETPEDSFLGSAIDLIRSVEDYSTFEIEMDGINVAFEDHLVKIKDYSKDTTPCSVRLVRLRKDDGRLTERDKLLLSQGANRMDVELDASDGSTMMSVVEQKSPGTYPLPIIIESSSYPDVGSLFTLEVSVEEPSSIQEEANRLNVEIDSSDDIDAISVVKSAIPKQVQALPDSHSQCNSHVDVELDNIDGTDSPSMSVVKSNSSGESPPLVKMESEKDSIVRSMNNSENIVEESSPKQINPVSVSQCAYSMDVEPDGIDSAMMSVVKSEIPQPVKLENDDSVLGSQATLEVSVESLDVGKLDSVNNLERSTKENSAMEIKRDLQEFDEFLEEKSFLSIDLGFAPAKKLKESFHEPVFIEVKYDDEFIVESKFNTVKDESVDIILEPKHSSPRHDSDSENTELFIPSPAPYDDDPAPRQLSSPEQSSMNDKLTYQCDFCHCYYENVDSLGQHLETHGISVHDLRLSGAAKKFVTSHSNSAINSANFDHTYAAKFINYFTSVSNDPNLNSSTDVVFINNPSTPTTRELEVPLKVDTDSELLMGLALSSEITSTVNDPSPNSNNFSVKNSSHKNTMPNVSKKQNDSGHIPQFSNNVGTTFGNDPPSTVDIIPHSPDVGYNIHSDYSCGKTNAIHNSGPNVINPVISCDVITSNDTAVSNNTTGMDSELPQASDSDFGLHIGPSFTLTDIGSNDFEKISSCSDVFKCTQCDIQLTTNVEFQEHLWAHTLNQLKCTICDSEFDSKEELKFHSESHAGYPLFCKQCNVQFKDIYKLRRHLWKHLYPLTCALCELTFTDLPDFREHIIFEHFSSDDHGFQCKHCSAEVSSEAEMNRHLKSHEPTIKCDKCSAEVSGLVEFLRHLRSHMPTYKCNQCSAEVSSLAKCTCHLKTHRPTYSQCSAEVSSEADLECHSKSHSPTYKCNQCEAEVSSEAELERHLKSHRPTLKCSQCSAEVSGASELLRHLKSHMPTFKCSHCSVEVSSNAELERHLKTHRIIYKCYQCSVVVSSVAELERHLKSHRPTFKCSQCSVVVRSEAELERHLKRHGITYKLNQSSAAELERLLKRHRIIHKLNQSSAAELERLLKRHRIIYKCYHCSAEVSSVAELERHLKSHEPIYKCHHCSAEVSSDAELECHLKRHRPSYKCNHCSAEVSSAAELERLLKRHRIIYKCYHCSAEVSSVAELERHLRSHEPIYKCHHCSAEVSSEAELERHLRSHEPIYKCHHCSAEVSSEAELECHLKRHRLSYKCNQCSAEVSSEAEFERHLMSHSITYKCYQCSAEVSAAELECHLKSHRQDRSEAELERHLKRHRITYKCNQCCAEVSSQAELQRHLKTHSNFPYKCYQCSAEVNSEAEHKRHLESHRIAYSCQQCSGEVRSLTEHEHHLKSHVSTFKCNQCSVEVSGASKLLRHFRSHRPPNKCDQCSAKVISWAELECHLQSHRPTFKCSQCFAAVNSEAGLECHLKSHRPTFKCSQCSAVVTCKVTLKRHSKIHGPTYKCNQCSVEENSEAEFKLHLKSHKPPRRFKIHRPMFKCNQCSKEVSSGDELKRHLKIHMLTFKCSKCRAAVKSVADLKHHLKIHGPIYKCNQCSAKVSSHVKLKSHFFNSHRPVFKCRQCSSEVSSELGLKRHLKIHEHIYKCSQCSAEVSSETEFKGHFKSHMPIFMCNQCNAAVSSMALFKLHLKSHIPKAKTAVS